MQKMKTCRTCAFLNAVYANANTVCSILKLAHPFEPGLYIKNPNCDASQCPNYRSCAPLEERGR